MKEASLEHIRLSLSSFKPAALEDRALTPAGVFLLLYYKNGEGHIIFNRRSDKVEHHKSEISFPGGASEPQDKSILSTAQREAYEEMGILSKDIQVLGELDSVGTSSRFRIYPFVGLIPYPYSFQVNPMEIAKVLEVPLSVLQEKPSHREEVRLKDSRLFKAYSYVYEGNIIHGATARIVTQFLEMISRP